MRTLKLTLPQYWAPALINGDLSGFDDDEEAEFARFCIDMVNEHGSCHCIDYDAESADFSRWHDAVAYGVLACDVMTYTFDVT
jgi:hypothetical protein